ncbi:glucose 1,6-bisphosphate synthase [Drosophila subobscura]|uniref:glucose 1,6-bisphosphate synthase n=1 Tax=Drosophila subobscura TaxID=7241 RepID=UPI00155A2916|nr:glucose 1,6-bisphosphate synthase [Drosophila subobscura]
MSSKKAQQTPAEVLKSLELSGQEDLDRQIKNWVLWDRNEATLDQVLDAVRDQDWQALRVRLCNRIPFGTGGLRGGMRAGFDSINDLVIIQTAQGLAAHLSDSYPSIQKRETQGVVVGYDGRYNSKRFAQLTSAVFLNNNYKVYLFNRMTPTPFIPFAITALKCLAGIVVTASHNPKEDNGFKVYAANGAQILPPSDTKIFEAIMANLEPKPSSWDLSILTGNPLVEDPYRQIYPLYYDTLRKLLPPVYLETNECSQLRFIYTPMHGVGYSFMREAFYQARLKPLIPVPEQKDPDPEFHTLVYPNPEEGREALLMAIKKAEAEHCTVILANDPDADRLAAAELDAKGRWKIFTGNELGALLAWWALESYRTRTSKPDVSNCVMLSSTVSSRIVGAIARAEGFTHVETLTGFKWMGNRALELQAAGRTVLFAFEESLGFMFGMSVADKDGIAAATQLATMACHLRSTRNLTLIEKLREIYETYGYHAAISSHYICEDPDLIETIFERLRNFEDDQPGTYPKSILDGAFEVVHVRDLTQGLDTAYADRKSRLPMIPSEQMITFSFTNGFVVSLRSTSRDHKLRYCSEICGLPEEKEWLELNDKLQRLTQAVIDEFYQPNLHGLMRASQFDAQ